jgi:lipopolysaccharide transport system permease protein
LFRRGAGVENYSAYVAAGLLVWFYIMETINQSVSLFVREQGFIQGTNLPLSVYVLRLTLQSLIRAGYAAIGCIGFLALSGVEISYTWAWSAVGILLVIAATPGAIIVFAFWGAFFPDGQYVVSNVMRIGMFLTPVFWTHGGEGGLRQTLYYWNPFTYFLEIVRDPILYGTVPIEAFLTCTAITVAVSLLAFLLLGRFRKKVVFVL